MDDERIIALFLERSEDAITQVQNKYGQRSLASAMQVLGNRQDAEECVSDALHILWTKIPPEQPQHLWAYLSRIIRNSACNKLDYRNADRRTSEAEVCLNELEGCLSTGQNPEQILEARQITAVINEFLDKLDQKNRIIFVRRYYYFDDCMQIAKQVGISRSAVNTRLHRLREALKRILKEEEMFL